MRLCASLCWTCSGLVPTPPWPPIDLGVLRVTFSAPSLLSLLPLRPPIVCTEAVYRGWPVLACEEVANERRVSGRQDTFARLHK